MKRVLITGMSATGKSSVLGALAARGYKTVDTDDGDWSERVEVADAAAGGPSHEWLWREDRIAQLLSTEDADVLFVGGTVRNQVKFYREFDHVVLLSASADVMTERLRSRTNNRYGKHPDELAEVLAFKRTVEPALRRAADIEVDTSGLLEPVVAKVLGLVSG